MSEITYEDLMKMDAPPPEPLILSKRIEVPITPLELDPVSDDRK